MKRLTKWVEDFTEFLKALNKMMKPLEALTIKFISWAGWVILAVYVLKQK